MKHDLKLTLISLFIFTGALAFSVPEARAQAGTTATGTDTATDLYQRSSGRFGRAGDLIGVEVFDQQNQRIGQIKDIVVDLHNGRVPLAVISTQNGDKLVAIPPQLLSPQPGQKKLVLNLDRQKLLTAPGFVAQNWPDFSNPSWAGSVYSYYRQPAYWQAPKNVSPVITEPAGAVRTPVWISGRDQDQQVDQVLRTYQQGKMQARITERRNYLAIPEPLYPVYPTMSANPVPASSAAMEPAGAEAPAPRSLGRLSRTTDLIGATVKDSTGATIGEIRDVVVDWPATRISYAVVQSGKTDQYYAIPPSALSRPNAQSKNVVLNVDRQKLSDAPTFTKSNWPDPADQTSLGEVYRFYGQSPYWTEGSQNVITQ